MTAHNLCLILALLAFVIAIVSRAVYIREGGPARIEWIAIGLALLTLAQLIP
jgi:uncharacterized YccA/Bax inhibitor family protein